MSEKVWGFKEKDAVGRIWHGELVNAPYYEIAEVDLVPVVSVEALKECCNIRLQFFGNSESDYAKGAKNVLNKMLSWAEKEAKKK